MDPNETLRILRALVAQLRADTDAAVREAHADELAEHFEALDNWMSSAGFLPRAWAAGRPSFDPVRDW